MLVLEVKKKYTILMLRLLFKTPEKLYSFVRVWE